MSRQRIALLGFAALAVIGAAIQAELPSAPPPPSVAIPSGIPPKKQNNVPAAPKYAASKVVHVTIYPGNALVTREVSVPAGKGSFELVVNPLPPRTVNSSLYSEGTEGVRVLATRYRMRPIQEDTREEVRKVEAQLKQLYQDALKVQSEILVNDQNMLMLTKLEGFTGATLKSLTEKGLVNGEAVITLTKYIMDTRTEKAQSQVTLNHQMHENKEQTEFTRRKLNDLSAGSSKIERDAVIVVDKSDAAESTVRLHYLVDAASWRPQYKFRGGKDKEKVQVEYLAAIVQQTGEDWSKVRLTLSTAEPMLNAAPPELAMLAVSVVPISQPAANGAPGFAYANNPGALKQKSEQLRGEGQQAYTSNSAIVGSKLFNDAAALEQSFELLAKDDALKQMKRESRRQRGDGPSVTYHLGTTLTIPSRNDEQVIEVAKLDMAPEYYYKAVPVLTKHVYRLADLTNKSEFVLLPGEATMYIGSDFVGRADLPLVAIGEQFTAGFGVDPQLQAQRQMVEKTKTTQGDNQVHKFEYRILVSSYKDETVKLQLWDRLPHADTESVGISLLKSEPKLSTDALYLRENRPSNLLRWDLKIEPTMNGEKALAVNYDFKLELGRQMTINSFSANQHDVGFTLPKK